MTKLILIFVYLLLAVPCFAADYYIAQNAAGGADGTDCANAYAIATYNAGGIPFNDLADDIVYFCDTSTYTTVLNTPTGGTSGHPCTLQAAPGDTPTWVGIDNAWIIDTDHVTMIGLKYQGDDEYDGPGIITGDYFEMDTCVMTNTGEYLGIQGNYYYIHHSTFSDPQERTTGESSQLNISACIDKGSYGRIINNTFIDGNGHGMIETAGQIYCYGDWRSGVDYIVIRDNVFYNTGTYYWGRPGGSSVAYDVTDHFFLFQKRSDYILLEGNIMYETSNNIGDGYGGGIHDHNAKNIIIRQNVQYDFDGFLADPWWSVNSNDNPENQYFYNNISYNSYGKYAVDGNSPSEAAWIILGSPTDASVYIENINIINNLLVSRDNGEAIKYLIGSGYQNNIDGSIRNNDFYAIPTDFWWKGSTYSTATVPGTLPTNNTVSGNIDADPLFTDAINQDFTLQYGSPAIDAGTSLTLADGAGSLTTELVVDDTGYFFDGWGIPGEIADNICIGSATNCAQIISINSAVSITLDAALTWSDNAPVYLDSDNDDIAFYGSAPDIGAYEYELGISMSGTADGSLESEIAAGTQTIILTPNNAEWETDVCSADKLLTMCDGDKSGAGYWDTELEWATADCSYTGPLDPVTLTIKASGYDSEYNEIVTCEIPANATISGEAITPVPSSFTISYETQPPAVPGGVQYVSGAGSMAYAQPCGSICVTDISQDEANVLMDFYHATAGPSWTTDTGWGTDPVVNNWYGVTVSAGHVTQINLNTNNLIGTIDWVNFFANLSNLEQLRLYDNTLAGSFTGAAFSAGMTYFSCWGNSNTFSGSIPSFPAGMTYFNCWGSSTTFSGSIPSFPAGMTTFSCGGSSNTFSGSIPSFPAGMTYFSCWGNSNTFSGSIPSFPAGMTYFDCWGNSNTFSGSIPAVTGISFSSKLYVFGTSGDITGWTASTVESTFKDFRIDGHDLTQDAVNQLMCDFDAAGSSNGSINVSGGTNAAPIGTGLTCKNNLVSRGWTVTTN